MKTVQMKSIFQIGQHVLQVFGNQGRWVEVDRFGTMSPARSFHARPGAGSAGGAPRPVLR